MVVLRRRSTNFSEKIAYVPRFGQSRRYLRAPAPRPLLGWNMIPLKLERIAKRGTSSDCLDEACNTVRIRWFKHEFIHPTGFKAVYKDEVLSHLFGYLSIERTVGPE
jgi:hypothetical protein